LTLLCPLQLGFPFEVLPSTFPENLSKSLSPFEYVLRTATEKCTLTYQAEIAHAARRDPALVIAADTIVVSSLGAILEKPRSEAQHIAMLKTLRSGGPHKVFTAVAVMAPLESARDPGYSLETTVEETTVKFDRDVTDELITAYVKTREGADKAGGYGLQGLGSVLVESVEGAADNVVGLPLRATLGLIERVLSHGDDLEDEFEKEGL
jgi:septum formation protein